MTGRRVRACLGFLVVIHVALAGITARSTSVTVDEAGHIASGVAHHQQASFASYRVNPPPARWLATLPVVLFQHPPELTPVTDKPGRRPEGAYGVELATALGPRYGSVVFTARLFNVLLSALGVWLVYTIGARAMGVRSGLLAAALYAFNPNIVAHAAVLSSDLPATVGLLAFTWALLRYSRRPTLVSALVLGVFLGLAQLTKFSAIVLYPATLAACAVGFGLARTLRTSHVAHALLAFATSLLVLNAGYAFSGTGARLADIAFVSKSFAGAPRDASTHAAGNRFRRSALGHLPVPLPLDYVIGIDLQRRDFEGAFRSYLDGAWYDHGFWFYYAYAMALKTPLATTALFGVAAVRFGARRVRVRRRLRTSLIVLVVVPLAFFVFISSQTGFSHHLRYVLPVIPFIALAIGGLARYLRHEGWPRRLLVGAVAMSALSCVFAVPHPLSYFNVLGGGWKHGDEHLIDSNLDWGQDLGRLGAWYRTHGDRPLRLAYFGGVDPHDVGLEYTLPPLEPEPGRFVLSVNFVRGMRFAAVDGASQQVTISEGRYAYFGEWEPTERIGTSIRVYEVSLEAANEARRRRGLRELSPRSVAEVPPAGTHQSLERTDQRP